MSHSLHVSLAAAGLMLSLGAVVRPRAELLGRAARRDREDHPRIPDQAIPRCCRKRSPSWRRSRPPTRPRSIRRRSRTTREAIFNSPRQVTIGNPQGDVTFVEFFDYNCGYCKRAMVDMIELMKQRSQAQGRAQGVPGARARPRSRRRASRSRSACRTRPARSISTSTRSCCPAAARSTRRARWRSPRRSASTWRGSRRTSAATRSGSRSKRASSSPRSSGSTARRAT